MTVQKSIKCDSCGKELCCVTQYPAVYAIEVSSINVNTPEGGGTYAVIVRPPFKEPHHFCNKECLARFLSLSDHNYQSLYNFTKEKLSYYNATPDEWDGFEAITFGLKQVPTKEHKEAINIIRTIRCMIDRDFNDKKFKQHVLSLLHSTSRGCIGHDKDVPEELIKYDFPKEWE